MTLDEAIKHCEDQAKDLKAKAKPYEKAPCTSVNKMYANSCLKCADEHEQLAEWLKHYQAIRQVIHNWSCDYPPVNPDRKAKHSKAEYFDMIIGTFEKGGEFHE